MNYIHWNGKIQNNFKDIKMNEKELNDNLDKIKQLLTFPDYDKIDLAIELIQSLKEPKIYKHLLKGIIISDEGKIDDKGVNENMDDKLEVTFHSYEENSQEGSDAENNPELATTPDDNYDPIADFIKYKEEENAKSDKSK